MADPLSIIMTMFLVFAVTLGALESLRRYAGHVGLVSFPGEHRQHTVPTPLVGGIGVFLGVSLGIWLLPVHEGVPFAVLLAGTVLVVTGVWDDIKEVSFATRFMAQAVAVGLMAWFADNSLRDLGFIFNTEHRLMLGQWGIALTIFAAVGVINAVNMSDGLDGLAGGLALVTCGSLLYASFASGNLSYVPFLGVVVAALLAFMLYNTRIPTFTAARLYLGDAGSLLVGFLISWFLIAMSQGPDRIIAPVTALWIFALPLFDTVAALLRRSLQGRSPFHADRTHYHHYLRQCGLSVNQSLLISLGIAVFLAAAGLAAQAAGIAEHLMFFGFLVLFAFYFGLMVYLDSRIEDDLVQEDNDQKPETKRPLS